MGRHSLTVTVDARSIFDRTRRGIAKTAIASYRALAVIRPDWTFRMLHRQPVRDDPFADIPNVVNERIEIRGDKYALWDRIRLPLANVLAGADVFHSPDGTAPARTMVPLVTTIHDLIPLEFRPNDPDVVGWMESVRRGGRNAARILTASEYSRGQIVEHLGVPESKVDIIHWAPFRTATYSPSAQECDTVRAKYGVPNGRRYVLHFGMGDPRKNTARTIDAWARLRPECRAQCVLLIVGVEGEALEQFRARADALGVRATALLHGYVPEPDIAGLLAGAVALCYPTSHEGFGLPILDAFAAGAAVVTGNTTSLPEVAGDAAILVDVSSTEALALGLEQLLANDDLRAEMVARGRRRLQSFSWEATATRMARTFEEVTGSR